MTVQLDFALVGFDQAGDHVEDRGLARPVRPQQANCLALSHREAYVLHNRSAAIALTEMMHGENALTSGRRPDSEADPSLSLRNHLRQRGTMTRSRTASSLIATVHCEWRETSAD